MLKRRKPNEKTTLPANRERHAANAAGGPVRALPSRRTEPKVIEAHETASEEKIGLLSILMRRKTGKNSRQTALVDAQETTAQLHEQRMLDISQRLEYAFKRLHQEFDHRERQLEAHLEEFRNQQERLLAGRRQRRKWVLPVAAIAALAVGYTLYLLTGMHHSMMAMSGDVGAMNGHINKMAEDTHNMANNINAMNQAMTDLNGNMAYMNRNVAGIAQATVPMAQTAQSISPFTQFFRGFLPF